MQQELLNQAMSIFDTSEKWNAFLELSNQRNFIQEAFLSKAKDPILKYFNSHPIEGWVCEPWGNHKYDFKWYLRDFGKNSLCLVLGWGFQFILFLDDSNSYDAEKINYLLQTPEYSKVLMSFDRIDRQFEEKFKVVEKKNYKFDSPFDSNFEDAQLAWYVGNMTEKFVEQIIRKVERFRSNEEITRLLYRLNEESKRS